MLATLPPAVLPDTTRSSESRTGAIPAYLARYPLTSWWRRATDARPVRAASRPGAGRDQVDQLIAEQAFKFGLTPAPEAAPSGGTTPHLLDLVSDGSCGFAVQPLHHTLVGVAGQSGGGMAELVGDDLDVDAGVEGEGGGAVAQVVQSDGWQPGLFDEAAEALGD